MYVKEEQVYTLYLAKQSINRMIIIIELDLNSQQYSVNMNFILNKVVDKYHANLFSHLAK